MADWAFWVVLEFWCVPGIPASKTETSLASSTVGMWRKSVKACTSGQEQTEDCLQDHQLRTYKKFGSSISHSCLQKRDDIFYLQTDIGRCCGLSWCLEADVESSCGLSCSPNVCVQGENELWIVAFCLKPTSLLWSHAEEGLPSDTDSCLWRGYCQGVSTGDFWMGNGPSMAGIFLCGDQSWHQQVCIMSFCHARLWFSTARIFVLCFLLFVFSLGEVWMMVSVSGEKDFGGKWKQFAAAAGVYLYGVHEYAVCKISCTMIADAFVLVTIKCVRHRCACGWA